MGRSNAIPTLIKSKEDLQMNEIISKQKFALSYIWALPACFIISSAGIFMILFEKSKGDTLINLIQIGAFILNMFLVFGFIITEAEKLKRTGRFKNSFLTIFLSNISGIILCCLFSLIVHLWVHGLTSFDGQILSNMTFEGLRDSIIRIGMVIAASCIGVFGYILPSYLIAKKHPEDVDKSNFPQVISESLANVQNELIEVRWQAIRDLGYVGKGSRDAIEALKKSLTDKESRIRYISAWSVRRIGSEAIITVPELVSMLENEKDERSKSFLEKTLKIISGENFGKDVPKWRDWIAVKGLN